ncbi:hypothetical protein E2C01_030087 [Portunus trituberculatus]|uniref:Uncharacterized protein n=1 Tax=Portunus trituberculatus TaxID=210409 RepID=A0A5B7ER57_PORTR|nr:hypothetical protein [Portunus trituberculatus]
MPIVIFFSLKVMSISCLNHYFIRIAPYFYTSVWKNISLNPLSAG